MHVTAGKKCVYIGNCTFAHSAEERDLWIYMKENNSRFFNLYLNSPLVFWSLCPHTACRPSLLPPSLLTLCSCRLGAALWAVAAVSEAGLGWRDGQQRSAGERQTDPDAHRLRWGSGESIFSVSLLFLVILLMCAVVGDKNSINA